MQEAMDSTKKNRLYIFVQNKFHPMVFQRSTQSEIIIILSNFKYFHGLKIFTAYTVRRILFQSDINNYITSQCAPSYYSPSLKPKRKIQQPTKALIANEKQTSPNHSGAQGLLQRAESAGAAEGRVLRGPATAACTSTIWTSLTAQCPGRASERPEHRRQSTRHQRDHKGTEGLVEAQQ